MKTDTDAQGLPTYSQDTNDELLKRLGVLATLVAMFISGGNPERARSAQDDVDRCRREALRRMGDQP